MPRRAITPDNTNMLRRYVGAIKLGHTVENASTIAGISSRSAWRWLAEGEENEDTPAARFSRTHKVGVAARMTLWLGKIAEAGRGWQGAGWLAERTDKNYGRNQPVELTRTSNTLNLVVSEGQAAGILARLASRGGGGAQNDPGGGTPTLPAAASSTPSESKHSAP